MNRKKITTTSKQAQLTNNHEDYSKTEVDVEADVIKIVNNTEDLVVCSYPTRDLDRLLSFYNAAKQSGRDLVIDLKQAYILKLFQTSDNWKSVYPKPKDKGIKIYIPKKGWGLIDKDIDYWTGIISSLLDRTCKNYPVSGDDMRVSQPAP
jgi:ribonuclease J